MSQRLTQTEKWDDVWFSNLSPLQKLLFIYCCDRCDIAGFLEINFRKISFEIGEKQSTIEGAFKGLSRGLLASRNGRFIFVRNFVKHQKNGKLNPDNRCHKSILEKINEKQHLFDFQILEIINKGEDLSPLEGASKPQVRAYSNSNSNSNKGGVGGIDPETFIEFFNQAKGSKEKPAKYRLNSKTVSMLRAREKDGYTFEDISKAIKNCKADTFHIQNPKYLTPEFILRPDKLEQYLNAEINTAQKHFPGATTNREYVL